MSRLWRNLLAIALLLWVAPLSAQQRTEGTGYEHWASADCPNESRKVVIRTEAHLGNVPMPEAARAAFLP